MRLYVDWMPDNRYIDGGSWAIFMANGHLFASMAQKGKNLNAFKRAQQVVTAFNAQQERDSD